MIVIEGPDLVGKTTLAKKLRDELMGDYFHFGPLPDDFDFVHGYAQFVKANRVMDRFHLSEIAYGRAVRGRSRVGDLERRAVDGCLKFNGCVTVLLTTTDAIGYRKHLDEHWTDKELFSKAELLRVWRAFDELRLDQQAFDFVRFIDRDGWADGSLATAIIRKYQWLQASIKPKPQPIR